MLKEKPSISMKESLPFALHMFPLSNGMNNFELFPSAWTGLFVFYSCCKEYFLSDMRKRSGSSKIFLKPTHQPSQDYCMVDHCMVGRYWKAHSQAAGELGGPDTLCPGLQVCLSVNMLSISQHSPPLRDSQSPMGDVDNPGNAHTDRLWAHTGLDRAFLDHGDIKNILSFEMHFLFSSLASSFPVIMSF